MLSSSFYFTSEEKKCFRPPLPLCINTVHLLLYQPLWSKHHYLKQTGKHCPGTVGTALLRQTFITVSLENLAAPVTVLCWVTGNSKFLTRVQDQLLMDFLSPILPMTMSQGYHTPTCQRYVALNSKHGYLQFNNYKNCCPLRLGFHIFIQKANSYIWI